MPNLDNQRIAKNTIVLYLRMFITMIVSLYTSRVVLLTLGFEDFGIYGVVGGVVSLFSFINAALSLSTSRFLTFEIGSNNFIKAQQVFSAAYIIHLMVALLIFILAETLGLWMFFNVLIIPEERFLAAMWVYQCSVFSMMINITQVPYNAAIISHEKMNIYAYVEFLNVILKLIIVYCLLIDSIDRLKLYSMLQLAVNVLIALIYRMYSKHHFSECMVTWKFETEIAKSMTGFTAWTILGNIAYIGITQGVNMLLNVFFGPVVNSARSIAVQVQSTLNGFWTNFLTAVNPQIIKSYASNDLVRMQELVVSSSLYSFYLLLLFTAPVLVETTVLLEIWLDKVPKYTVAFVQLSLIVSLLDCMSEPLVNAIKATGRIKVYQVVISIVLLFILPVSYILFKLGCSPFYVYIVNVLISLISLFIRVCFARKLIGISLAYYVKRVFLRAFIVAIISFAFIFLLKYFFIPSGIFQTLLFCCLIFVQTSIFVFFLGLQKNERYVLLSYCKNKISKK